MARWTPDRVTDAKGKIIVITGANSGIGLQASRLLAERGATVVMACRSRPKAEAAAAGIREELPQADLQLADLDLSSLASVRAFAADFRDRHGRLDVLINNAGIMAIPRAVTEDGFEMQLGTNHLGHFALTGLLLEPLLAAGGARVVNVSSMAHRWGRLRFDDLMNERRYNKWDVYGQSKLANLLFTLELQRRLMQKGADIICLACHPGYANTNLQLVGPRQENSTVGEAIMRLGNATVAQSAEKGAWPTLYAALDPCAQGGDFIGPSGFMAMVGAPVSQRSSRAARDAGSASRLWQASVELTGVNFAALD